jgi:cytidyltransferase-like protein
MSAQVVVCGGFDDIRSRHLRFLQEASKLGQVTLLLWPDEVIELSTGSPPKFPFSERRYFLNAVRFVSRVLPFPSTTDLDSLPELDGVHPSIWADEENTRNEARRAFCDNRGIGYRVFTTSDLAGFPALDPTPSSPGRKKVIATGCYDWFHSGHVRFAEEASTYGDLYIVVGHDANIRLLKGAGHPLLPEDERRYVVGSIRFVKQALVSSGNGWLDADPEIRQIKPDAYIVNEDGDKGGKRDYCQKMGLEYIVLKRTPAPGLPRRSSTDLRGF